MRARRDCGLSRRCRRAADESGCQARRAPQPDAARRRHPLVRERDLGRHPPRRRLSQPRHRHERRHPLQVREDARRHAIVKIYDAAFAGRPEIQTPTTRPGIDHAWHLYPIRLHLDRLRINRSQFIDELRKRNIGASVHFIPIHFHPFYRDKYGYKPEDLPIASAEYQRLVSLPLNPRMSDADVNDVIEAVNDISVAFAR